MAFPALTVFLIFIVTTYIYRARLSAKQRKREEAFWKREEEAENTPSVDLSTITDYIKIPVESFDMGVCDDDEVMMIEEELRRIAGRRILNLNGQTNTDIKIAYGTSNFEVVSQMGEDFDRMLVLLCDYAKSLMENGLYYQAARVLEFGKEAGSDISSNYILLGDCYRELNREDDIRELKDHVAASGLALKESIIRQLDMTLDGEPDTQDTVLEN